MAGLPKKYAKMGFKEGWKAYKKAKRSRSRPKSRSTRNPGGAKRMAKGFLNAQTLMKFVRIGALAAPAATAILEPGRPLDYKLKNALRMYTGFNVNDGSFDWSWLVRGWTPYLASVLATYGIPKIAGIIRRL